MDIIRITLDIDPCESCKGQLGEMHVLGCPEEPCVPCSLRDKVEVALFTCEHGEAELARVLDGVDENKSVQDYLDTH